MTTDIHEQLRRTARDLLQKECPPSHVRSLIGDERGYSPELWRIMADVGWTGLNVPEEHEGAGLGFGELAIVLEEAGRALLPGPFLATTVLGVMPIALAGSEEARSRLLPGVARGEIILTGAYFEPGSWFDWAAVSTVAKASGEGFTLTGVKFPSPFAHVADYIVTTARDEDGKLGLFVVDARAAGVAVSTVETLDWQMEGEVALDEVAVPGEFVLASSDGESMVERVVRAAATATSLLSLGAASRALEIANEYARSRVAFGRPIGTFQAIKHKLANMLVDVEAGRALAYKAVQTIVEETPDEAEAVAAAKAWCSDAARHVTNEAMQIHGGIGYTWEHDMHLYLRRAQALARSFGDADFHRDAVARLKFGDAR